MKKTKLLALISAILVLATVLCSCGGLKEAKPGKVLTGTYANDTKLLNSATQVDLGTAEIVRSSGKLVFLRDDSGEKTKWLVYNLESGATVYTYTDTETAALSSFDLYETDEPEIGVFTVTIRTQANADSDVTYATGLYDEKGTQIAVAADRDVTLEFGLDLMVFDGKCYRVAEDHTVTEVTGWNELINADLLETRAGRTENYYYFYNPGSSVSITVYGKDMNYVTTYSFPSYAEDCTVGVIGDGKLFFQYSVKQPDDAQKYDYLTAEAEKYNLVTGIYNVKKEKSTSLKMEYKVEMVVSRELASFRDEFSAFADKIYAIAVAYEIKDGRLNESNESVQYIALNKNGKATYLLSGMFPGMTELLMPVGENLYVYGTANGAEYLVNKDGDVYGDISGRRGMNNKYIFGENKLYNMDLTVALDFKAEKMKYLTSGGNVSYTDEGVFFTKEDGSIWFYNGELTEVVSKLDLVWKTLTVKRSYFSVRKDEGASSSTYQYFSAGGKSLLLTDYSVNQVAEYEGTFLFVGTKNGSPVYYRLAA